MSIQKTIVSLALGTTMFASGFGVTAPDSGYGIFSAFSITASAADNGTGVYKVNTASGLNIRSGPGTGYSKLGAATKGTQFTVTKTQNGWGYGIIKCTNGSKTGWACLQYCTKTGNSDNERSVNYKVKITTKAGLNMRSQANTESSKMGAIPYNTTVTITKECNGFGYTNYSGKNGWICLQYTAKISGNDNPQPGTVVEYPLRGARCSWRGFNNSTWSWSENRYGSGHTTERVYHLGLDLTSTNSSVYACAAGTVVACSSSASGANGRYVIIKHNIGGKTVYSFYAHLSSVNVKNGQSVNTNTKIGVVGGSGYGKNSYYGTHLHFAIMDTLWTNGAYYGYSTKFSGNAKYYGGVTYYNPKFVVENDRLP
ncbi:SH3 domain-containing protein [Ruminococcus albus]|uniref:SH3 domain protein n=1 Tax=Ruminococcus albus 8 TaxID=246199 RepID=E9SF97_RUMAL|nr:SH3 domain-containing protein [Ruminococcus albus]EGC02046.1 SH3 domain protein [Ruminococcus albus 8]MCC3351143.1 peptidoglycan DD-metalloendopeptidase family protein [Ruminococcus albus 8]